MYLSGLRRLPAASSSRAVNAVLNRLQWLPANGGGDTASQEQAQGLPLSESQQAAWALAALGGQLAAPSWAAGGAVVHALTTPLAQAPVPEAAVAVAAGEQPLLSGKALQVPGELQQQQRTAEAAAEYVLQEPALPAPLSELPGQVGGQEPEPRALQDSALVPALAAAHVMQQPACEAKAAAAPAAAVAAWQPQQQQAAASPVTEHPPAPQRPVQARFALPPTPQAAGASASPPAVQQWHASEQQPAPHGQPRGPAPRPRTSQAHAALAAQGTLPQQQAVPAGRRGAGRRSSAARAAARAVAAAAPGSRTARLSARQLTSYITHDLYGPAARALASGHGRAGGGQGGGSGAGGAIERYIAGAGEVLRSSPRLNTIHLAAVLTRLAYLVRDAQLPRYAASGLAGLPQLLAQVEARFAGSYAEGLSAAALDQQSLTNLLWAAAKLGHRPSPDFMQGVLELLQRVGLDSVCPQGLANALWAIASIGTDHYALPPALVAGLAQALAKQASSCCAQDISNALWALATVGRAQYRPAGAVVEDLAAAALATVPRFTSQGVGNTLWALGKLEVNPLQGELVDALLAQLDRRLHCFSAQEVVNSVWGAAALRHPRVPLALLDRVEAAAAAGMGQYLPLQVAALLTAFAQLQYVPRRAAFLSALDAHLTARVGRARGQELANTMHALGQLNVRPCGNALAAMHARQAELIAVSGTGRPLNVLSFLAGATHLGCGPGALDVLAAKKYMQATAGASGGAGGSDAEAAQYAWLARRAGVLALACGDGSAGSGGAGSSGCVHESPSGSSGCEWEALGVVGMEEEVGESIAQLFAVAPPAFDARAGVDGHW